MTHVEIVLYVLLVYYHDFASVIMKSFMRGGKYCNNFVINRKKKK